MSYISILINPFSPDETTVAPDEDKSLWEKIEEFYSDNNNMAMYCVLPIIVLVYGGCSFIYCVYKCRRCFRGYGSPHPSPMSPPITRESPLSPVSDPYLPVSPPITRESPLSPVSAPYLPVSPPTAHDFPPLPPPSFPVVDIHSFSVRGFTTI